MNTQAKAKKLFTPRQIVVVMFLSSILLITLVYLYTKTPAKFSKKEPSSGTGSPSQSVLIDADEMLHARLLSLQQMDREYASLYHEAASDAAVDVARLSIQDAEQALSSTLDSIENGRKKMDDNVSADLWKLTTYFKTIMENRRFLTAVKSAGTSPDTLDAPDKLYLLALEEELKQKEAFIVQLRNQSQNGGSRITTKPQGKKTVTVTSSQQDDELELIYKPAPGETIEELRQRNINLRLAFNNTATQLGVLTKKYNLLIKDYQRLNNQLPGTSSNR